LTVRDDRALRDPGAADESADKRSSELRLFLEEVSCDLCRYRHTADGVRAEDVRIHQEVFLGLPGAFADIKVSVPGAAPYFVEVKYGYPPEKVVRHLERKFGAATPGGRDAAKLVLVIDSAPSADWPATEREIRRSIRPELALEIWDESMLLSLLRSQFGLSIGRLTDIAPTELHAAIDRSKGWRPSRSRSSTIRCRLRSSGTSGHGFCGAFATSRARLRAQCCRPGSIRTSSRSSPI
jgi:hypothetical protein